ncbi:MAG: hypothetical protein N2444_08605 [Methylocystis sp.]|nr:hypothetical protein [Methylocystis sp.]
MFEVIANRARGHFATPRERALPVAAGGMPVGLAMAQKQETSHYGLSNTARREWGFGRRGETPPGKEGDAALYPIARAVQAAARIVCSKVRAYA